MATKTMNAETAIKNYLDNFAQNDNEFAVKYANPNKSMEGCLKYICSEVGKMRDNQQCIALTDEEVYGMAVHYYDEEDIKVEESAPIAKVVVADTTPNATSTPEPKKTTRRKRNVVADDEIEPLDIPLF